MIRLLAYFLAFGIWLPLCAEAAVPPCYRDIERNIFRPEYVSQALSFQMLIGQSSWSGINTAIQQRSRNLTSLVQERGRQRRPNPFDVPYDPERAGEVFQSVVLDILRDALAQFNIYNQVVLMQIFEYLKDKNIDLWDRCFVTGVPLH